MKLFRVLFFVTLTISFAAVVQKLEIFSKLKENLNYNCSYHDSEIWGPEDFAKIDSKTLLISQDDKLTLHNSPVPLNDQKNGSILAAIAQEDSLQIHTCFIHNLPATYSFHPHGIYYDEKQGRLFVINHSYEEKGGDRVEIFRLIRNSVTSRIELIFEISLKFGEDFNGNLNDLIVLTEKSFLITRYLHFSDGVKGRVEENFWSNLGNTLYAVLNIRSSHVYYCNFEEGLICEKLENTRNIMVNGITYDKTNKIVALAESIEGMIYFYNLKNQKELEFLQKVKVNGHPDNVIFDEFENHYIVGSFGRLYDHILFNKVAKQVNGLPNVKSYSVVDVITVKNDGFNVENLLTSLETNKCLSSAIIFGNRLLLGSWSDKSLMICNKGL